MSKMMRINDKIAKNLDMLTELTGKSKQLILEKAIENFAREQFLKKANEAYAELKKDPKAWKEYQKEQEEWDTTLADGLDNE